VPTDRTRTPSIAGTYRGNGGGRKPVPLRGIPEHRRGCRRRSKRGPAVKAFGYTVVEDPADAVRIAARTPNSTFIAGGTDLLNLMRDGAEVHDHLVDSG
jgi:hypothetical protein